LGKGEDTLAGLDFKPWIQPFEARMREPMMRASLIATTTQERGKSRPGKEGGRE